MSIIHKTWVLSTLPLSLNHFVVLVGGRLFAENTVLPYASDTNYEYGPTIRQRSRELTQRSLAKPVTKPTKNGGSSESKSWMSKHRKRRGQQRKRKPQQVATHHRRMRDEKRQTKAVMARRSLQKGHFLAQRVARRRQSG